LFIPTEKYIFLIIKKMIGNYNDDYNYFDVWKNKNELKLN
jgi:hypothetical protein